MRLARRNTLFCVRECGGGDATLAAKFILAEAGTRMRAKNAIPPIACTVGSHASAPRNDQEQKHGGLAIVKTGVVPTTLTFNLRHWDHAGFAFSAFGIAFVALRFWGSHWPDRLGGVRLTLISLAVEALGLALLWLAMDPGLALLGAGLTGAGCSLIFPAMGVEVVKRVPAQATAVGGYSAFQDVAYALTGPLTGMLATAFGYGSVFGAAMLCALVGVVVTLLFARQRWLDSGDSGL